MLEMDEVERFAAQGWLLPHWRFSRACINRLLQALPALDRREESTVMESDKITQRAIHGGHEDILFSLSLRETGGY